MRTAGLATGKVLASFPPSGQRWPIGHPFMPPKMPSTDGSCPSTQGHLLVGAALMLCRLTVSPAHLPHPPLQSPARPGSQCFRQMASCLEPLGWYLLASSPACLPPEARCVHIEPWDSTDFLSEYGCYPDPLSLQGVRRTSLWLSWV